MLKSILLSSLLLFAMAEPACDTRTSDERGPNEVKPGENPIPETKTQYEQAPPPAYNEPTPTFEATDSALNARNADGTPYWSAIGCDKAETLNGGRPWPQGGVQ